MTSEENSVDSAKNTDENQELSVTKKVSDPEEAEKFEKNSVEPRWTFQQEKEFTVVPYLQTMIMMAK